MQAVIRSTISSGKNKLNQKFISDCRSRGKKKPIRSPITIPKTRDTSIKIKRFLFFFFIG